MNNTNLTNIVNNYAAPEVKGPSNGTIVSVGSTTIAVSGHPLLGKIINRWNDKFGGSASITKLSVTPEGMSAPSESETAPIWSTTDMKNIVRVQPTGRTLSAVPLAVETLLREKGQK